MNRTQVVDKVSCSGIEAGVGCKDRYSQVEEDALVLGGTALGRGYVSLSDGSPWFCV